MNEQHPVRDTLKWVALGLLVGLLLVIAYRLINPAPPKDDVHGNLVVPH